MELSLREKIALQRQVKENLDTLKAGVSNLRERISLQRQVKEGLDKLRGITTQPEKSDYQRLLDGEYDNLAPLKFYAKVKDICSAEISARYAMDRDTTKTDVDLAREPVSNYFAKYYDPATDSMKTAA